METAAEVDRSPLARAEATVKAEATATTTILAREAGFSAEATLEALESVRRQAWAGLLGADGPAALETRVRGGGLRGAATALRAHGLRHVAGVTPAPLPEGLTAEALRGALSEIIPGRRSVAGLYLRGYTREEMAILYGLDGAEMRARLEGALENLRSSLHRRAERLNAPSWSRALEQQPIQALQGTLRETGPTTGSRLRCPDPFDLAEAVNGTHFRGGREGALDHSLTCDPCAAELRVLFALRLAPRPAAGPQLDAPGLEELRRAARSRPDLRDSLDLVDPPAPRRRRIWPWVLLVAAAALLAILLS